MPKYRATATVTWDFVSDQSFADALEQAKQQAQALIRTGKVQDCIQHYIQDLEAAQRLPPGESIPGLDVRAVLRLDRIKEKHRKISIGEFLPDDVLPFIVKEDAKRIYKVDGKDYAVRMNSHRYFIFQQSLACAACGVVGTKMMLEHHPTDKSPHFNLYAEEDGNLILMTKDHILAKSVGGEDRHSNYQTMCIICNNLKGSSNLTLAGIMQLRAIYNENKHTLSRKKLHEALELARTQLELPPASNAPRKQAPTVSSDLNIWKSSDALLAKAVYERGEPNHEHIACISKGTEVVLVEKDNQRAVLRFSPDQTFTVAATMLSKE